MNLDANNHSVFLLNYHLVLVIKLWKEYFWSRSYCLITTGGAPIDIIRKYIENQGMKWGEKMLKAYKFRIYPNEEQKVYLAKTFGCTRFVYNKMLADRIKSYEENKDLGIKTMKYPTPAQYKNEFEWLNQESKKAVIIGEKLE